MARPKPRALSNRRIPTTSSLLPAQLIALDTLAARLGRDRSSIVREAIERFLALHPMPQAEEQAVVVET